MTNAQAELIFEEFFRQALVARRTVCCRLSFLSTCACGKTHSLLPSEFSFDLRLWQDAQFVAV